MTDSPSTSAPDLLELAIELTIAWLANPNTRASAEEVPGFLEKMHGAVKTLAGQQAIVEEEASPVDEYRPAVTVRRSLASKDHIVSMIDGKPYKTLKRHLSTHGLSPAEYRVRYGLKSDYPMVAENYGAMRREMAKKIGLGRKPGQPIASKAAPKSASKPAPKAFAKSAEKTPEKPASAPKAPRRRAAASAAS